MMTVYFRRPNGKLGAYEADYVDHAVAIDAVRKVERLPAGQPVLASIEGGKKSFTASIPTKKP